MPTTASNITKQPDRCGGHACVRDTRITVWGLVEWQRLGLADEEILRRVKGLTLADLDAAREYAAAHPVEIERALWENEACMVEQGHTVPPELVRRGRELGLSDEAIRNAFEPPLSQEALAEALAAREA
jgi:uncharacterized protein (DUF433 family)